MTAPSQRDQVRAALEAGHRVTPLDALLEWGCYRLAARIDEIRRAGVHVITERHPDGYAIYYIPQEKTQ
jgi:hypothetical protein